MTLRPLLLGLVLTVCVGGTAFAGPSSPAGRPPAPSASPPLTVPPVSAPSTVKTYTLEQSLDVGLRQNPVVRVADEAVATAAAQYGQQQSQKNLQFLVTDQTTLQPKRTVSVGPFSASEKDSVASQVKTSLQLLLTTFGLVENQIAAAFLQIGVEAENAQTTRRNLNYQIKQAFFQRLKSDATVEVAGLNLGVSKQSLSDTEKLFAQGVMARYDVVQAQLQVTEAVQQLATAENSVKVTSVDFLTVLNESIRGMVSLVPPDPIEVDPAVTGEELQTLGLSRRPEIVSLERSLDVAHTLLKAAHSQSRPTIAVSADYIASPGYLTALQNVYQLTFNMNWALWDGGLRDASVQEAESQIRSLDSSGEDLRNQVRLQIQTSWLDFQLTTVNLETARQRVAAAEVYYDMARQRFLNGLGTSLEVQDALRKLNDARQNLVVATYNRDLAFAAIENSVGMDFPDRRLAVSPEMLQAPKDQTPR